MGSESHPRTVGLVLAGGRSRRMGSDKALLSWRGETLLSHMQHCLRASGASRVLVSGAYADCEAVPDRFAGLGPLGGLASVVETLPDDVALLVVPVDMPLLDPHLLRYLRMGSHGHACAHFHGQPLPLYLRLDCNSRAVLMQLLQATAPQRSIRALHSALQGKSLKLPLRYHPQLEDADTPEAWLRLQQAASAA